MCRMNKKNDAMNTVTATIRRNFYGQPLRKLAMNFQESKPKSQKAKKPKSQKAKKPKSQKAKKAKKLG
jgi:hypothetical protein